MPWSVDYYWTIPSMCTNGDFGPLQMHSYLPISDWWHGVYIEIWGPAIYHACPTVNLASKAFTRCQIVLHNPSVNLEIVCAFIHSLINCIRNTDFIWSIFPVTIFYSLSLMLDKEWSVWQAHSMYNAYFIQHFFTLHHPLHVFWASENTPRLRDLSQIV